MVVFGATSIIFCPFVVVDSALDVIKRRGRFAECLKRNWHRWFVLTLDDVVG